MVRWCVIACVVVSLGGCSALFARGPGSRKMSCTDFPALPIVDTVIAVSSAVGIGVFFQRESECTGEHCGIGILPAIPLVPVVLVTVPSALWGYNTVAKCRAYKRQYVHEARAVEELEVQVRGLAAEGKCTELAPLWDELLAREAELNFEHNIRKMEMGRCAAVIKPAPDWW